MSRTAPIGVSSVKQSNQITSNWFVNFFLIFFNYVPLIAVNENVIPLTKE